MIRLLQAALVLVVAIGFCEAPAMVSELWRMCTPYGFEFESIWCFLSGLALTAFPFAVFFAYCILPIIFVGALGWAFIKRKAKGDR